MNIGIKEDRLRLKKFYISQIEENFFPYWKNFIDVEFGGIFTCINNFGNTLISEDKYIWSQGRFLWVLSYLYKISKGEIINLDTDFLKLHAEKLKNFIINKCIIEGNRVAFLTGKNGIIRKDPVSGKIDASIFTDCFIVLGLASFALIFEDLKSFNAAFNIYKSILDRINSKFFLSEPYPIPKNLYSHSIPMIMINLETELLKAARKLKRKSEKKIILSLLEKHINEIMNDFYWNEQINEFIINKKNNKIPQSEIIELHEMLLKHKNPGHAIESMWFIIEAEELIQKSKYLDRNCKVILKCLNLGWDHTEGGLLRFINEDGNIPNGNICNERYEKLIQETWNMKLWWPHSETLYALLLCSYKENIPIISDWFEKVFEYTYSIFPNTEIGEWIQIRKRNGQPEEKVVALPVKDPFHILRFLIKSILLIDKRDS